MSGRTQRAPRSTKIEVLFKDKWYEATVASRDSDFLANVCYADGSVEASVEESRILNL